MGQQYSFAVKILQDHAHVLKDLAVLTHEGLIGAVRHLNKTLKSFAEGRNHKIIFAVKELSDVTYLWKATIRIFCYKVDSSTGRVLSQRVLDLRQFCKLYRDIIKQVRHAHCTTGEEWEKVDCHGETCVTCPVSLEEARETLSASMIITSSRKRPLKESDSHKVDEVAAENPEKEECCICMDQKAEAILACVHSFCRNCIDQWSLVSSTCPVCRNEIQGNKDLWEMSEPPSQREIEQFVIGLAEGAGAPT